MKVSLLDMERLHEPILEEIQGAVLKTIKSGKFIMGPEVEQIEKAICGYLGVKYAVAVASGTDALLLSLKAIGIEHGDGVVTSPYTFFATAGAIKNAGGEPIFVDIERPTFNIDPARLKDYLFKEANYKKDGFPYNKKRSLKIKAIVPVHLFGQMAPMKHIIEIANEFGLKVIEDSAQSIGAKENDRQSGTIGDLGCFSFFPAKNLGCFGDGGMVATNDEELAGRVRILRNHGGTKKNFYEMIGTNSRLDTIQAAVLLVKLKYLDKWTVMRRENASYYDKRFSESNNVVKPYVGKNNYHVFNQYVIRVKDRDKFQDYLNKNDISTAVYYPRSLHLQTCFSYLGHRKGDFPESERAQEESLAIPIYPGLAKEEIDYVVEKIESYYGG